MDFEKIKKQNEEKQERLRREREEANKRIVRNIKQGKGKRS